MQDEAFAILNILFQFLKHRPGVILSTQIHGSIIFQSFTNSPLTFFDTLFPVRRVQILPTAFLTVLFERHSSA
jgi:hypothetical protein